jgi:hypothetical protein
VLSKRRGKKLLFNRMKRETCATSASSPL